MMFTMGKSLAVPAYGQVCCAGLGLLAQCGDQLLLTVPPSPALVVSEGWRPRQEQWLSRIPPASSVG